MRTSKQTYTCKNTNVSCACVCVRASVLTYTNARRSRMLRPIGQNMVANVRCDDKHMYTPTANEQDLAMCSRMVKRNRCMSVWGLRAWADPPRNIRFKLLSLVKQSSGHIVYVCVLMILAGTFQSPCTDPHVPTNETCKLAHDSTVHTEWRTCGTPTSRWWRLEDDGRTK